MVYKDVRRQFYKNKAWGLLTSLDLFDCDPKKVRSKKAVARFVCELCDLIKMKRFRETVVVHFGDDPSVSGLSFMQLIETSLVSGHTVDGTNAVYLDIFSCKIYDPKVAEKFAKKFFGAKKVNSKYMVRRNEPYSKSERSLETIAHDPTKWFFEGGEFIKNSGLMNALKIRKKLHSEKSIYQQIDVYDTVRFGRMLTLDGSVMFTDAHEFTYHEMISHPAMFTHPDPKHILIIGGGDGGVARELLKHKSVKRIDLCDIDSRVIDISKKYFPKVAVSLDNSKVHIYNEDGSKFLDERTNTYDLIIVDSTDPIGPGRTLFMKKFFQKVNNALKKDGIAIHQMESIFLHAKIIKKSFSVMKSIYPKCRYYNAATPMYPGGTIGFAFCAKKYDPIRDFNGKKAKSFDGKFKYYSPEIHKAAFALPEFAKKFAE